MLSESSICIEVIHAFYALYETLDDFSQNLQASSLPIWLGDLHSATDLPQIVDHKARAIWLFQQLTYLPAQDPKAVLVCPGLIAADEALVQAALAVNHSKDRFQKAMAALKEAKIKKDHPLLCEPLDEWFHKRHPNMGFALKRAGLARLQLKQCYRHIPILSAHPKKVSWTWANTTSVKRIDMAEATRLLLKRGDDMGIQLQLKKLQTLREFEQLAIIQKLVPHLRANVVFENENAVDRKMLRANIPILYPYEASRPLPFFRQPKAKPASDATRTRRDDKQISDEVFLPAIRAHRYT